ncbi:jg22812 [Pararge aegeria aegeria]|uniref:Jg22812 protein n=1 Tax=Pararge aegeria aegeria TaxID=348720 RepID=A0A8S4RUS8_9NEOP|nr:jg22812 [Pararge aegeria aegeria]
MSECRVGRSAASAVVCSGISIGEAAEPPSPAPREFTMRRPARARRARLAGFPPPACRANWRLAITQ